MFSLPPRKDTPFQKEPNVYTNMVKKKQLRLIFGGIVIYGGFLVTFCYFATITSQTALKQTAEDIEETDDVFAFDSTAAARYFSSTRRVFQAALTPDPVVNSHPFNFTISNSDACTTRSENNGGVFLVLLVKCRPDERFDREQVRRTWGGVQEVLGRRVLTKFLIGTVDDPSVEQRITEEDKNHHDLIQEDFKDTYYNLTYKNIMGWRWVSTYCADTKYVMSVDVDMMINIRNLVMRLEKMPRRQFAEGRLKIGAPSVRDKKSKWYVSEEEYAAPTYPPFLNGGCYVVTADVAALIFKTSAYVPFFKLDDVYVGMVLSKAGVKLYYSKLYQQLTPNKYQALKEGIGIGIPHNRHGIDPKYIDEWNSVVGSKLEQDKLILPKDLFN